MWKNIIIHKYKNIYMLLDYTYYIINTCEKNINIINTA